MRYGAKTRPGESVKDWGLKSSGGGGGSTLSLSSPTATTASPGDGYNYYIFTASGTIDATGEGPVQVLVFGGGAASAWTSQSSYWHPNPYGNTWSGSIGPAGGGGAGGFIEQEIKMYEGTYTVTVGAGGSGPNSSFDYADKGGTSFIAEHPSHPGGPPTWQDIVAWGGGGIFLQGPGNFPLIGSTRAIQDPNSFAPDSYAPFNPTNRPETYDGPNYRQNTPKDYSLRWMGGSGSGEPAYGPSGGYTPNTWMSFAARDGQGNIGGDAQQQSNPSGPWGGNRGQAGGGGGAGGPGYKSPEPNSPPNSPYPDYPQPGPARAAGGMGGEGKQSPLLTNILPSIPTLSSDTIAGGGGGGTAPAPFAPSGAYGGPGQNGGGAGGPGDSGWPYPPTTGQGTDGAANTGGGAGGNGWPGNSNPPPGGSRNIGNSGGSGIIVIRIAT